MIGLLAGLAIGMILGIVLVIAATVHVERQDARRIQRYLESDDYLELPWSDPQLERLLEAVRRESSGLDE